VWADVPPSARTGGTRVTVYKETPVHIARITGAAVAAALLASSAVISGESSLKNQLTVAVFGDTPYGDAKTDTLQTLATPAFISSINSDPDVDLLLDVGDIHSGKQFCTEAYDRMIADFWTTFDKPLIYTPGDNEWTDCHKPGEGGHVYLDPPANTQPADYADGNPAANLDLVRSIFFANAGYSLGRHPKQVTTQAQQYDARFPTDGYFVENVMWEQKGVLFVDVNVPGGSNNDHDIWYGTSTMSAEQAADLTQRTGNGVDTGYGADHKGAVGRWLDAAFARAAANGARAVVIQLQADMWDRDGKAVSHIAQYEDVISNIAGHALTFGRPVLLLNGDSHSYRSDNPLKQGQPCEFESGVDAGTVACSTIPNASDGSFTQDAWVNHPGYDVPNFHRIVVHGSTHTASDGSRPPMEWLKLTITPGANPPAGPNTFGPFAWTRVITSAGAVTVP
jgi:hypothetical protein